MPYYIEIDTEIDHRGDGGGVVFSVYNTSLVRCDDKICRQEGWGNNRDVGRDMRPFTGHWAGQLGKVGSNNSIYKGITLQLVKGRYWLGYKLYRSDLYSIIFLQNLENHHDDLARRVLAKT